MKNYWRLFLLRGMMFGGFGPIVVGVVCALRTISGAETSFGGTEVCLAIVSTYLLAFLHAGASVLLQIERWSLLRIFVCHFLTLYVAYVGCYLVNTWIPFEPKMLLLFTGGFLFLYVIIWLVVYLSLKATSRRLNQSLRR